jgi:hypothetical protein
MTKLYLAGHQALKIPKQQTGHSVLIGIKQKRCLNCTSCNDIEVIHHKTGKYRKVSKC